MSRFSLNKTVVQKKLNWLLTSLQPSPIKCEGSPSHPNCRLPIYLTADMAKLRTRIIDAYVKSGDCGNGCKFKPIDLEGLEEDICPKCGGRIIPDDEDRRRGASFIGQCLLCIVEDSDVRKTVGEKQVKLLSKARMFAEKKYGVSE